MHRFREEAIVLNTPSLPEAMATREILRELASNGSLLIQRHIKLAELEARRNGKQEKKTAELLGVAGAFAYAGVILLLVAAALGIGVALGDRHWAGALIVGGVLLIFAAALAPIGWKSHVKKPLRRTRDELEKELSWGRSQLTT
jgi:hypothetical protein